MLPEYIFSENNFLFQNKQKKYWKVAFFFFFKFFHISLTSGLIKDSYSHICFCIQSVAYVVDKNKQVS